MIDLHCHLDLFDQPDELAEKCEQSRIYVLSVTTTPKAWRHTIKLAKNRRYIRTALGLHPQLAHERHIEMPLFEGLLDQTRYVGEIGLDGSPAFRQHAEIQRKVFERALAASKSAGGRIFSVHSRGAASAVISSLVKYGCPDTAILHWFSGSTTELRAAISAGCWFSIGAAMLRSEKGKNLISKMPRDRLLTETDGPFAKWNGKPLSPLNMGQTLSEISKLWSSSTSEVDAQVNRNFVELSSRVPEVGLTEY